MRKLDDFNYWKESGDIRLPYIASRRMNWHRHTGENLSLLRQINVDTACDRDFLFINSNKFSHK